MNHISAFKKPTYCKMLLMDYFKGNKPEDRDQVSGFRVLGEERAFVAKGNRKSVR